MLVLRIQTIGAVESLFWRLPYDSRRAIVRAFSVDTGVSNSLIEEILQRKVLFIRIPKTAGMAVQQSLFGGQIYRHQVFRQYELIFPKEVLDSFYSFAFVRNPWDRLVSAWTYLRENSLGQNTIDPWGGRWFADNLARYPDFETFVLRWVSKKNVEKSYIHFRPQSQFVKDSRGETAVQFIGRFETLADDFRRVAQALGCDAALEVRNRTRTRQSAAYRDRYSPRTTEIVAAAYEEDIRAFGYEF